MLLSLVVNKHSLGAYDWKYMNEGGIVVSLDLKIIDSGWTQNHPISYSHWLYWVVIPASFPDLQNPFLLAFSATLFF